MTIQEYMRILRRRGWIIIVSMLLGAIAAFGVSYLQEDLYRATVEVSNRRDRTGDWAIRPKI